MDDSQAHAELARVEHAAQNLANRITALPLDPRWEVLKLSDAAVSALYAHTTSLLAYRNRWWRFASFTFRRVRTAIQSLCPEAHGESVWTTAESLQNYCSARLLRTGLATLSQDLVPGIRPTNLENEARLCQFLKVVRECLDNALDLTVSLRSKHRSTTCWKLWFLLMQRVTCLHC